MEENVITNVKVAGMHCPACQKIIEKKLSRIVGVGQVIVNIEGGQVEIIGSRSVPTEEIMAALKGTEYKIS